MNPYEIIKSRRVTEKSRVLENLQHANSNASLKKCKSPKLVYNVASCANKTEIAKAFEEIYKDKKVKVVAVNTCNIHRKTRRMRGHEGKISGVKKAVITLRPGDAIDEKV